MLPRPHISDVLEMRMLDVVVLAVLGRTQEK